MSKKPYITGAASGIKPAPKLSLSQWAEKHGMLSPETSAQSGKFRAFGYQKGLLDAFTDPAVAEISVMKSARIGFTRVLDMAVGYFLAQDPCPILVVQPRVEDAQDYSKREITPMLRDTPVLAAITGDLKAKDSGHTILQKSFLNGSSLSLIGANSPGGFRRVTIRVVFFDEIDGYVVGGAGSEGDQIALGTKRTQTFWNSKVAAGSTPTIKGISRIEKRYETSDQRKYYVPCPHCQEMQVLEWGGKETSHGIKWQKDERGRGIPETACYVCINGCIIDESAKERMIARGEWRASKPFKGHAGFWIWAGYSLFPKASWVNLVAEWLAAKSDPLQRQTFVNLVLGLPYEDRGEGALNERTLASRVEVWAGEVPSGVAVLTAGVDVQDDRVEMEVVGWGRNEESWSIAHEVIEGDPDTTMLWAEVDGILKRRWTRSDGKAFEVLAACIDSGGHHTQKVYEFCKARLGRHIWAIKGESARAGARSPVWPTKRPSARNKVTFRPVIIGVNAAKDVIRNRLNLSIPAPGTPSPGYMHFPTDRDINYFAQLVSERLVTKTLNGQRFRVWELSPGRANEALDMRVYAYAALCGLLHMGLKLNVRADDAAEPFAPAVPAPFNAPENRPGAPPEVAPLARALPAVQIVEQAARKPSIASRLA